MMNSGTIYFLAQINCNFNATYKKIFISSSGMFTKIKSSEVMQRTYLITELKNQRPKPLLCVFNYGLE